jgi:hypothetical protein
VYVLVLVGFTLGSRLAARRRFPDLLGERRRGDHARDVEPWDRGLVLVARTSLEDRAPIEELPGYRQSAAATKHRLVHGVW